MSNRPLTLKDKIATIIGGFLFTILVVVGFSLAVNKAEAVVVMERPVNIAVYNTDRRGVNLVAVDTPSSVCYYTETWGTPTSAPSCISKMVTQ